MWGHFGKFIVIGETGMKFKKWGMALGATALLAFATPQFAQAETKDDIFIVYKNDTGKQAVIDEATTVVKDFEAFKTIEGAFTDEALKRLKANKDIQLIEDDTATYETSAVDTSVLQSLTNPTWNLSMTGVKTPWTQGLTGKNVKIAVLDTGVGNLAAFKDVTKLSFVTDNPRTARNEADPIDTDGHGTAVTSVIIGSKQITTDGTLVGIAPNADVYSLKVFDNDGAEMSTILSAVEWCIKNNVQLLNMSLGASEKDPILLRAVNAANEAGLTIVAASGNESTFSRIAPVDYPAAYSGVIGVASVDEFKTHSYFSNGGNEVDFVAPGEDVRVQSLKGGTKLDSGTSYSAPHITAMLALLKERYPTYTRNQLHYLLSKYSEDLGAKGRDVLYGDGLVNFETLALKEDASTDVPASEKPTTTIPKDDDGSSIPTSSDDEKIETQNDAKQYIRQYQTDITKIISKIQENKTLTLGAEFTRVYSLYSELSAPEQSFIKKYNKKLKTVVVSATTKTSKMSANNLSKMKAKKTTQIKFATAIKPSTLAKSNVYIYKDGIKQNGFTLKKAASGKAIRITFTNDLKPGHYVMMIDSKNMKTKAGKKITTPFAVKFTVK